MQGQSEANGKVTNFQSIRERFNQSEKPEIKPKPMSGPGGVGGRQKSIIRPPPGQNPLVITPSDILKGKQGLNLVEEKRDSAKRTSQLKIPDAFLQGNNPPKTAPKPAEKPKLPGRDTLKPPNRPPKPGPVNRSGTPEPVKKEDPESGHSVTNTSSTEPLFKKTPMKPPNSSPTNTNIANGKKPSGGTKKYVLKELPTNLGPAPRKPAKPPNVPATKILGRLPSLPPSNAKLGRLPSLPPQDDDFGLVYDDVEATSAERAKSPKRVSAISPMSAEDEREMDEAGESGEDNDIYDCVDQDDDNVSQSSRNRIKDADDNEQEVYEMFDDLDSETALQRQKDEKAKKEKERLEKEEAKKKEKEFKETCRNSKMEEKLLKKQLKKEQKRKKEEEKEQKEIRAKLKLTGAETVINTGYMKEDTRGGKFDLAMKKNDKISILRMNNNPAGKWLCRNQNDKVGYVDAKSIQVDTNQIRQVMQTAKNVVEEDEYADADGQVEDVYEVIGL